MPVIRTFPDKLKKPLWARKTRSSKKTPSEVEKVAVFAVFSRFRQHSARRGDSKSSNTSARKLMVSEYEREVWEDTSFIKKRGAKPRAA